MNASYMTERFYFILFFVLWNILRNRKIFYIITYFIYYSSVIQWNYKQSRALKLCFLGNVRDFSKFLRVRKKWEHFIDYANEVRRLEAIVAPHRCHACDCKREGCELDFYSGKWIIMHLYFHYFANKAKRDVGFRHPTHYVSKIRRKLENGVS